ncbi:uncharacterized protein DUF4386 [Larkinella arboricola]|uniref:Uncharacterized protein DUF4386 n=1 Tax=Larkinella arboricola TaxID=643671 RepID=A0A327WVQ3_LARAB|nr:DUF4386 domain-containing protein [Larkinella arboricola]RAJ97391.1 uncharacterized protein DUF4386 [Larkinella arboricola]
MLDRTRKVFILVIQLGRGYSIGCHLVALKTDKRLLLTLFPSKPMVDTSKPAPQISLQTAALLAGSAVLIMVFAIPFAEFAVYQKLVVPQKPAETIQNIRANLPLFRTGILCYLITFFCDVLAAWALYLFLKPAHEQLSLLTAWLRVVYAAVNLTVLLNLVTVLRLLTPTDYVTVVDAEQLQTQVMLSLRSFRSGWSFTFNLFGIYLCLLGYLVFRSNYIPGLLGILLAIAGLGYLIDNIRPFVVPDFVINSTLILITGAFEVVFVGWLLIKGTRIEQPA